MKFSQYRFLMSLAGALAILGCTQSPSTRSTLGNLPGQDPLATDQPRINAATYCAHGHLLERQGQFERAIVQYRKALALTPDFETARNRLGITLNKIGRNADASEQFRLALAQHPDEAYLHNNLGFSLYLEQKYDEAIAEIQTALKLNPNFARAHMNYALVLAQQQKYDQAFEELSQAGSRTDAYFNMGVILTEAQKYAEASQYLEAALAANPNFDAARQQLLLVSRLAAEQEAQQAVSDAIAAGSKAKQTPGAAVSDSTSARVAIANTAPSTADERHTGAQPAPEEPPVAIAQQPPTSPQIEDVPINQPASSSDTTTNEKPFSETTVSAAQNEPANDSYEATPVAASTDTQQQEQKQAQEQEEAVAVAPTPTPPPAPRSSSVVIIEDIAINKPSASQSRQQNATASTSTPQPAQLSKQQTQQVQPQPVAANAANSEPSPANYPDSTVVVETIALTPGAGSSTSRSAQSPQTSNMNDKSVASNGFDNNQNNRTVVDDEKLMRMINDALYALQHNPAEFDELWCQLNIYLDERMTSENQKPVGK